MAKEDYRELAKKIKSLGLSVREFSSIVGVTEPTTRSWALENKKSTRRVPEYAKKIIDAMMKNKDKAKMLIENRPPVVDSGDYAKFMGLAQDKNMVMDDMNEALGLHRSTVAKWREKGRSVPVYGFVSLWLADPLPSKGRKARPIKSL